MIISGEEQRKSWKQQYGFKLRIRPILAWYDFWIGFYYSRSSKALYILPIPCVGIVIFW